VIELPIDKQPNVARDQKNAEDGQAVGDIHIFNDTGVYGSGGR
jgi:hypothetical protein